MAGEPLALEVSRVSTRPELPTYRMLQTTVENGVGTVTF
jgi:hypothetical protein